MKQTIRKEKKKEKVIKIRGAIAEQVTPRNTKAPRPLRGAGQDPIHIHSPEKRRRGIGNSGEWGVAEQVRRDMSNDEDGGGGEGEVGEVGEVGEKGKQIQATELQS